MPRFLFIKKRKAISRQLNAKLLPSRRVAARVALPPLISLVTALPARSFVCLPQVRALSESTQAFIRPRISQVNMPKRRHASSEKASAGTAAGTIKRSKKVDLSQRYSLQRAFLLRCYSPRSHTTPSSTRRTGCRANLAADFAFVCISRRKMNQCRMLPKRRHDGHKPRRPQLSKQRLQAPSTG